MSEQVKTGNKMADMPIVKLIVTMALPMMLSMMIQTLYNIVDSVFIGMLPERAEALQALGYAYPVQMLMVAAGVGTGVGAGALLSKALGMNNAKKADAAAGNGYFLMLCFTVVFAVFGLFVFFGGAYFDICTSNEVVAEYGRKYLGVCLMFSLGQFVQLMGERTLCSTGRTNLAMIMQLAGALTNIALDPLFIFVFDMGVVGAAVATVIGQWVSMIVGLILNIKFNPEIRVSVKAMVTPNRRALCEIFKVGLLAIVLQCLQSLTTLVMQITFGFLYSGAEKDLLVGIYGIFYKLQYFVLMLVYGLNNAAIPVIAFNYGMGNGGRVKKAIVASTVVALIIGVLGLILFEAAPAPLLRCFHASSEAVRARERTRNRRSDNADFRYRVPDRRVQHNFRRRFSGDWLRRALDDRGSTAASGRTYARKLRYGSVLRRERNVVGRGHRRSSRVRLRARDHAARSEKVRFSAR